MGSGSFERMFDIDLEGVPRRLDEMEPGPVLAGFLASVDVTRLSGHDRVVVLRAHQRMASHYNARIYEDMAAVTDSMEQMGDDPLLAAETAAAEIRAALRLTRRAADSELGFALDVKRRLPGVWGSLASGDIDLRRARTIAYGVVHLSDDAARLVVDRVIEQARRLTTGQLAARIRRLCIETDPAEAERRYDRAVADRRITVTPAESGTANLFALDLPPHRVVAVTDRINRIARSLRARNETRTMDQLRADVFLDLLEGTAQASGFGKGSVNIHVDLETLSRLSESPGELAGYGPVIADIARQVAEGQTSSEWRYTVTDPATGRLVQTGTTRR